MFAVIVITLKSHNVFRNKVIGKLNLYSVAMPKMSFYFRIYN